MDIDVKNLHPLEVRLLRAVKKGESITTERITDELGYKVGQCNQAFSWLSAKGCIEETKRERRRFMSSPTSDANGRRTVCLSKESSPS